MDLVCAGRTHSFISETSQIFRMLKSVSDVKKKLSKSNGKSITQISLKKKRETRTIKKKRGTRSTPFKEPTNLELGLHLF